MMGGIRKVRLLVLAAVCGLCLPLSIPRAMGQDAAGSHAGASDNVQNSSSGLAKESHEAGNQDKQSEFKRSGSVRLVARLTGLSLDHAYWLCVLLNFAVVAGAIFWASKKYLPGMFRDRTASIQHAMAAARKTSEEANRRLANIEARLSHLGSEIDDIRKLAEKEAADEEERIKSAASEDARRIVESAEQGIAAAARTARRDLTAYAADLAVSLARKQIHVDSATDEGLIRNFSDHLSDSASGKN